MTLQREAMGNTSPDKRGPQQILEAMLRDEQGLRLLAQAIIDGRAGTQPRRVTVGGDFQRGVRDEYGAWHEDPTGKPMPIEDDWLRYEIYPENAALPQPVAPPNETPRMKATRLKSQITQYIEQANLWVDELANVEDPGPTPPRQGWMGKTDRGPEPSDGRPLADQLLGTSRRTPDAPLQRMK
ncbi:hypothetical protein ABZ252_28480 [Streptomyces sp. NPDC006175]|uniref:hypothetical protein n=1 Tax=Streptomyces sp. NPDC006175 TaxID=3154471 RepID=UPI0033AB3D2A